MRKDATEMKNLHGFKEKLDKFTEKKIIQEFLNKEKQSGSEIP